MSELIQGVLALVCLTVIALMCLHYGVDGNLLMACIIGVCGLGGYELYAKTKEVK